MTSERIDKQKPVFSWIRDRITPALLFTLSGILVFAIVDFKTLTFDTPEEKYDVKRYMSLVKNFGAYDSILGHINNNEIHKSFFIMDSLWVSRSEYNSDMKTILNNVNDINSQIYTTNALLRDLSKKINHDK
jgi:hypothetical protein